ncbi:MAG: hypothetical protein Q9180_004661 [Flavoplaca navasiana]
MWSVTVNSISTKTRTNLRFWREISPPERLTMTSTPYQMLLRRIRHIYWWYHPIEIAKYLAVYILLWALDYIGGAAVLALIRIVKRRLYPFTLEDIRREINRSKDAQMMAINITQLIEQRASHG